MGSPRTIAILALQGDFAEHGQSLRALGARTFEIRQASDLSRPFDGLVIPGGESTVMGKLLRELNLFEPLRRKLAEEGLPVMATCAGLILLAQRIADDPTKHFATLDVTVRRNAYGRQLGSFFTQGSFGALENVPMSFIRAPSIVEVGPEVQVLSTFHGQPTAVRQGHQLAMAFHPELLTDTRIHQYFLEEVCHE
jgi:pyridoxal 5'-phosphate synthase pdxT subunit